MQDLNGDPWVMMQAEITLHRVYESMLTIFIPIHTHTITLIGTKSQSALQSSRMSVYIGYCTGEEALDFMSDFLRVGATASTENTLTDTLISEFSETRGFFSLASVSQMERMEAVRYKDNDLYQAVSFTR